MLALLPTEYQQWQQHVIANQADWQREQGRTQSATMAGAAAQRLKDNNEGATALANLLTPYGAPVTRLLPRWLQIADQSGLTLKDFATGAQDYFSQITSPDENARWWGSDAWLRVPIQGAAIRHPEFSWTGYTDPAHENAQQNEIGARLTAEQQTHGGSGSLGAILAVVGAVAAIVTGGLSLVGTLGEIGATAGLGEVASVAAAAGDAGFIGAAGASELAGAGAFTAGSAFSFTKNAYSVANGVASLTTGSPEQPHVTTGAPHMSNPFFAIQGGRPDVAQTSDAQNMQAVTPAQVGKTPPSPAQGLTMPFGVSVETIALVAIFGAVVWAFMDGKKA